MGMENDVMLSYLGDNERFADTFNFGFFNGEQVVHADDLTEASEIYRPSIREIYYTAKQRAAEESTKVNTTTAKNTSSSATKQKLKKQKRKKQQQQPATRMRDLIKTLNTGQSLKIVAIESQNDINYLMPWRIMNYDDKEYEKQIKQITQKHKRDDKAGRKIYRNSSERLSKFRADDRLNPVYTLCVYHGTKPWDGPRNLKDLMDFGTENPELWEQIFADYPMRIICLNEIDDFSGFSSSARELFQLLPHCNTKKEILEFINANPEYRNLNDDETIEAIGCITDIPSLIEKKEKYKTEGGYDMCQAIKELIEDSKAEGRADTLTLTGRVYKFLQANPNSYDETIATACECTVDDVTEIRVALGI